MIMNILEEEILRSLECLSDKELSPHHETAKARISCVIDYLEFYRDMHKEAKKK